MKPGDAINAAPSAALQEALARADLSARVPPDCRTGEEAALCFLASVVRKQSQAAGAQDMTPSQRRRAAAGNTSEPYPCCGKEAGRYGRPKGTICRDCRSLIDEGKAARKAIGPDLKPYTWTQAHHGWPRFYGSKAQIPSQAHDVLGDAFFDLVQLITRPAPANTPWRPPGDTSGDWPKVLSHELSRSDAWIPGWRCLILADPKAVTVLDALHRAILAALEAVYAEGKERGGSALFGLASGELSLNDFEQSILPPRERRA